MTTALSELVTQSRQSCNRLSFTSGPCEVDQKCVVCQSADRIAALAALMPGVEA